MGELQSESLSISIFKIDVALLALSSDAPPFDSKYQLYKYTSDHEDFSIKVNLLITAISAMSRCKKIVR